MSMPNLHPPPGNHVMGQGPWSPFSRMDHATAERSIEAYCRANSSGQDEDKLLGSAVDAEK